MCYFYIKSYSVTNVTWWGKMTSERNHNKFDQLVLKKRWGIYIWGMRLTNQNKAIYKVDNSLNTSKFCLP